MTTGTADEFSSRAQGRLGTVLRGKYRIDRVLGVGGMAVVYAATHRNKKRFAVKMLHPELSLNGEIRARFLREGYVANSVEHPGAVAVLDDDVAEDGAAFIVMELLDGAGVEQLWEQRGNRFPPRIVLALSHQLLDVLASAHARSIVHRDIKPANVFLMRDGTLKVLDFGIARLRDATSEHATQTGMMMGTPAFMAPEQAQGQSSHIDGLTDVWAVGATMFSLLSGSTVHRGDNPQMMMIQAATQPARSITGAVGGVPPAVVGVVDRALAFDKAHRWPSAAAMRDAVRDAYQAAYSSPVSPQPLAELFMSGDGSRHAERSAPDAGPAPLTPLPHPARGVHGTATPVVMAAAPAVTPPGQLAGGTTAQPISTDPNAEDRVVLPRSSSTRIVLPAVAIVAVLGIGVVATSIGGATPGASPQGAESPMPSIAIDAAVLGQAPSAPLATLAPPGPEPTGTVTPQPAASQHASFEHGPPPHPAAAQPPATMVKRAAPPAPIPAAATPQCRVVPYFDSDGNKRFRQECP